MVWPSRFSPKEVLGRKLLVALIASAERRLLRRLMGKSPRFEWGRELSEMRFSEWFSWRHVSGEMDWVIDSRG